MNDLSREETWPLIIY